MKKSLQACRKFLSCDRELQEPISGAKRWVARLLIFNILVPASVVQHLETQIAW